MRTSMRKASPIVAGLVAGSIFGAGLSSGTVHADLLGSILKGGGIAFLIKQFNRPLNDGINKLTNSAGAPLTEATKVVPIVSVGQGGYVGAAQVTGPQATLKDVQAVGMLEGGLNGKVFRLKALVPIDTTKPNGSTGLRRIKGVGVSAIIDIHV